MNADFITALNEIEREKGISKEVIFEAVESALVNAYKKNFGKNDNVRVIIDRVKGDIKVYSYKNVVNKREYELLDGEISVEGAQEIDLKYEEGDVVEEEVTPKNFGRVAAQTARQMVVQKIKEASRKIVFEEFSLLKSEIISGEIVRIVPVKKQKNDDGIQEPQENSKPNVLISLSTTGSKGQEIEYEALLPVKEQMSTEVYKLNSRKTVYIVDVKSKNDVPEIIVSRAHSDLVKRLFEREVPEIKDGLVQIKSIAREAGSRTKMSVLSLDPDIDSIGACVGQGGRRVGVIVDELRGEKIDIIEYSEDPVEYISSALSPAKVLSVELIEGETKKDRSALVIVPDNQLSLAIGKEGQNARLAAKLTEWKIDIKSEKEEE